MFNIGVSLVLFYYITNTKKMKKQNLIIPTIIILAPFIVWAASNTISSRLSGRILLDVEKNGEAWYVFPTDLRRYFLKRPSDAFDLMRKFGKGISDADLNMIPVGLIDNNNRDTDLDGLPDKLETALGTDLSKKDSDDDGYDDKTEIQNQQNPLGKGSMAINKSLVQKNSGLIFLQVEKNGEAWYLNPVDGRRYFLGSPSDAFDLMRKIGLGIKSSELEKIAIGGTTVPFPVPATPISTSTSLIQNPGEALTGAADAIRQGDIAKTQSFFIPEMRKSIEYGVKALSPASRLILANILSGSTLDKKSDTEATYKNKVYFSLKSQEIPITFTVKKQGDGGWLMASL